MPRRLPIAALMGLAMTACATPPGLPPPSSPAWALHHDATVVDLHVDPTLWNDPLLEQGDRQATLPSLKAGGVDVVILGVATQGLPIIGGWRPFTWWRGFPKEARRSPWAAALHQINQMEAAAEASGGSMRIVRTATQLKAAGQAGATAALIGIEGGHALEGELERLKELRARGVFYIGPVHLSDNDLGGSNYQLGPLGPGGGLTEEGRAFVRAMETLGLVVDLAHASAQTFDDILAQTQGPVMVSHTGIAAVHNSWRNLSDDQLRAVAARGGVVGVMFGNHYLGEDTIEAWVDHTLHAVKIMGAKHVAIGTDFDGFVPLPKGIQTAADLPKLTQALLARGVSEGDVRLILGGSFVAFMERVDRWRGGLNAQIVQ